MIDWWRRSDTYAQWSFLISGLLMDELAKKPLEATKQVVTSNAEAPIGIRAGAAMTNLAIGALTRQGHVTDRPQHEWGEVVVLVGTSTAGKSTIISELIKQTPGMIERGVDLAFRYIPLNYLNTHHPDEMAYLERVIEPAQNEVWNPSYLLNYIDADAEHRKQPDFKVDVSVSDRNQFREVVERLYASLLEGIPGDSPDAYNHSIVTRMMDEIILESKQGRAVACDILQINEVALTALSMQLPSVKLALVFVPFQTLAERVITRNNEAIAGGDFGNARPGVFPLEQFTRLFRPRNATDLDGEIVQKLTLREVKYAIDTLFENSRSFLESHDPEGLANLQQATDRDRSVILAKFGFEEGDHPDKVVELTPSFKGYHMLINIAQTQQPKMEAVQTAVRQILAKH